MTQNQEEPTPFEDQDTPTESVLDATPRAQAGALRGDRHQQIAQKLAKKLSSALDRSDDALTRALLSQKK